MPEQPNPKPGKEPVYPLVMEELEGVLAAAKERGGATATSKMAVFPALQYLFTLRVEQGRQKYGTLLMSENGRNALRDAWEECFDMCMYLKQAELEGYQQIRHLLNRSLWSLFDLTRLLMWQDKALAKECGYVQPKGSAAGKVQFPDYRREAGE